MTDHLRSAAHVLEQILREMHPQYDWVVTIRERERLNGQGPTAPAIGLGDPRAMSDDASAIGDRHTRASSDRSDDDAINEAA